MKYYFSKTNINPIEPAYAVGFVVDKQKYSETKLDLNMRLLMLEDNDNSIILLSLDNLGVSYDVYQEFADIAKNKYPNSYLLVCCTHTHYAPSLANELPINVCDEVYKKQVLKTFDEALSKIKLNEIDAYVDYHQMPFNKVGSPRISKKSPENVYAGTISFFNGEERIGNILFYNCHPTEDSKDPGYFSGAFIADSIRRLENKYPNEFFMYLQGCSGDVSSRFTRLERSFKQTLIFGELMADCFNSLISSNKPKEKLSLSYNHKYYQFKAQFKEMPELKEDMLAQLKPEERNELLIGYEELKKYLSMDMPENNDVPLSRINLGSYKLFFSPFELFTDYNSLINKDNTLLIGYCNNILAYLLPLDNKEISYEYFLETTTNDDKKIVIDAINNL